MYLKELYNAPREPWVWMSQIPHTPSWLKHDRVDSLTTVVTSAHQRSPSWSSESCHIVLQLLHILIAHIEGRKVSSLTSFGSNEDTIVLAALKVSLAFDRAVILARGLVKGDSNP